MPTDANKGTEAEEVSGVEAQMGRCRRYMEKGKSNTQCPKTATLQPYSGKNKHVVYCQECHEITKEKNRKRKKESRSTKMKTIKVEKRNILEVVMSGKLSPVIVKSEQYVVITLSLAFLSQIFTFRDAFHNSLAEVRKDKN